MNALVLLVSGLMFLMSLALYVWSKKQLHLFKYEIQSKMDNCHINSELTALNAGSIGLGERFIKMEKQMQQLQIMINELESKMQSSSPYAYAIELVQKGSTIDNIVELCHISQTEAELMVMMHRNSRAA
ncbi:hypothetical protein MNBD_GAMMA11-3072 [hydrothermal vent metagenome]|uniref:DUF2802 domain-containing protein n=1 Tax=hydrothermal vent metagenome TaxID=652676 RepID=A0A3B0XHB6_9ZZZZ